MILGHRGIGGQDLHRPPISLYQKQFRKKILCLIIFQMVRGVIKNYGEYCCLVWTNGKAWIFNKGSGVSNLSNSVWQVSVVSYGWEKVCFEVCHKSWIMNNTLTWNFVSNCKKVLTKHTNVKISLWWCCSDHEDGLQVVRAISSFLWIGWTRGEIGTSFNIKNPTECWKSKRNDSIKQATDY